VTGATPGIIVRIEAVGGFVGYNASSHVRTHGEVDLHGLPDEERLAVERLLKQGATRGEQPGPHYRLSWEQDGQTRQADVGEGDLTPSLRASLKTDLV
jgi:hypothetical protein